MNPDIDKIKKNCNRANCSDMQEYRYIMDVLQSALLIGEGILVNGGETREVEETIEKICKAYGAQSVDVWAITNLINASMVMPDGLEVSFNKRISKNGINIARLQKIHNIAQIYIKDKPSLEKRKELYNNAVSVEPYSNMVLVLSGAVCSAGWCLYFGGTIWDTLVAALLGFIALFCQNKVAKYFNNMATTIIIAALSGILAALMLKMGFHVSYSFIVISVIMLQIPTLQVVNGNRELFGGDIVCGTLKILQAVLTTIAIALGYAVAMVMFKYKPTETVALVPHSEFILGGCLGVMGYAFIFKAPLKSFPFIFVGGFITALLDLYFSNMQINNFVSAFICSIFVMFYSVSLAKLTKESSINSLLLPIITILLPGKDFYYSINYLVNFNSAKFWNNFDYLIEIVLGIAFGIIAVTLLLEFIKKIIEQYSSSKTE